jgi:hypothetical protein
MKYLLLMPALLLPISTAAASETTDGAEFFEKRVRPVLAQHCYACHSVKSGKSKGGLRVDSRAALLRGGDSGPAMLPREPEKSLLIQVLQHGEDLVKMPPKGKLPAGVIADLREWVGRGAPWPSAPSGTETAQATATESGGKHWAWQPLRRSTPPAVRNASWLHGAIDRYILADLEAKNLAPAPPAEALVLLRRIYFDLTGLPPGSQEIEEFTQARGNHSQATLEKWIDRLLASPDFGERWGRHWLDVARYADSCGCGANLVFDDAWRYRDYVIDTFNADRPFSQFIREQLAGDLLPAMTDDDRSRQLIATGFLLLGPKELAEYDKEKMRLDIVDEQIDTVGKVFLGLTLGCARCHDHKFDPVPTREYYALAGILRSTRSIADERASGPISSLPRRPLPMPADKATALNDLLKSVQTDLANAQAELKRLKNGNDAKLIGNAEKNVRLLQAEVGKLQAQIPKALAVADEAKPADIAILIRGEPSNRGAIASRGFLSLGGRDGGSLGDPNRSGRRELAEWVVRQPLTARVLVNRVWYWLMGSGLVRSVDNFGARGERPSHPELLDYLAERFVSEGWSIKKLIREIMCSATYQMSARNDVSASTIDPENRLLWHHARRRLEAEEIRDAVLAVSGQLDRTHGGPTNVNTGRLGAEGQGLKVEADPWRRRSVYLPIYRGGYAPDLFGVFDFPDSGLVTGSRNQTTVPTQALFMMNSPFMKEQADKAAQHLLDTLPSDDQRLKSIYRQLLTRPPSSSEQTRAHNFLAEYRQGWQRSDGRAERAGDRAAWSALIQALMASNDFLFVD